MPRISGRSSLTTTSPIRLRPRVRSVSRWFCLPPMPDLRWVTLRRAITTRQPGRPGAQQRGRGDVLERAAHGARPPPRDARGPCSAATVACTMLIALSEPSDLLSTSWMPAHSSTARTGPPAMTPVPGDGRTQQDDAGRRLTLDRVRDGALDPGDLEEGLLGLLDALGDRRGHLLGLAVADADRAVAVADDDERGEAEATTALDDLGDAVDRDDALDVRGLLARHRRDAVVTVATAVRRSPSPPPGARCACCAGDLASDVSSSS